MTIQHDTIRQAMSRPEWTGIDRGVYRVELELPGAVAVELDLQEAVLLRQVERLLQRVVDQNRRALVAIGGSEEPKALTDRAWQILEPVRATRYCDGEYRMTFPSSEVVAFHVTEWDGALLERYDALLGRIYLENRSAVDGALLEKAS